MMSGKVIVAMMICCFLVFLVPPISAKEVKTVDGYITFIPLASDTENGYDYAIKFNPPDGISEIVSMVIALKGDFDTNVRLSILLNRNICHPETWKTPSIAATTGEKTTNYMIMFDCTDAIRDFKGGEIPLNIKSQGISENLIATYKLTYYNDPKPSEVDLSEKSKTLFNTVQIFGTEYISGDEGTVFLQLLDSNRNPINDGYCELTTYYPDENKTKWLDNIYMEFLENGIYYKDLIIPSSKGTYIVNAYCFYADVLYEFKLPYNVSYDPTSTLIDQSNVPYNVKDTDCVAFKTENGNWQEYIFNNMEIGNINLLTITSLDLIWVGANDKSGGNYLQAWNFTSSSWKNIGSDFDKSAGMTQCMDNRGIKRTITDNFDDFVNGNVMRFRMWENTKGKIYTDEATIIFHNNGSIITDIRGSAEIHVSDALANLSVNINANVTKEIIRDIWNYSNRTTISYEIIVGGTEYNSGGKGKVYAQFLRTTSGSSTPISDGTCNITMFYPNNTRFVKNKLMKYLNLSNGIYYYNFTVPNLIGVYAVDVFCKKAGVQTYSSDTFHVGEWANHIANLTLNVTINISSIENLLRQHNTSIWNKLYNIQNELSDISISITDLENLIYSHNMTIMDYLYDMNRSLWYEIYNLQIGLINITNITLTLLPNMTTIPKDVYLYFDAVEERLIHNHDYCISNNTVHRKELLTEKCVSGDCFNVTRNVDEVCNYGCNQGVCMPAPYIKYTWVLVAIIAILAFLCVIYYISRRI